MDRIPTWLRILVLALAILTLSSPLAACGDDEQVAPAAFTSPVDGHQYCAWVNNPHECDGSGYAPMPFVSGATEPPAYGDPACTTAAMMADEMATLTSI